MLRISPPRCTSSKRGAPGRRARARTPTCPATGGRRGASAVCHRVGFRFPRSRSTLTVLPLATALDDQRKRHLAARVASGAKARRWRVRAPDRRELEHRRCRNEAEGVARTRRGRTPSSQAKAQLAGSSFSAAILVRRDGDRGGQADDRPRRTRQQTTARPLTSPRGVVAANPSGCAVRLRGDRLFGRRASRVLAVLRQERPGGQPRGARCFA
jgi:hypothetical protein